MKRIVYRTYRTGQDGIERVQHEGQFEPGKYNEYYLPSLNTNGSMRVFFIEEDGTETQIHLKR